MVIEVFNRYEKKYLIDGDTYKRMTEKLASHMRIDEFNMEGKLYNISNIYYDTSDDSLIRASLEKPEYKEKLRLRSYGTVGSGDEVFLEIKKKCGGIVNKRRTKLKLDEAYRLLADGTQPDGADYVNRQVLREIQYFLKIYDLMPKVYLTYDRMAFFEKDDDDFRVTFDTNIRTRRYDLKFEKGDYGEALLDEGSWLMEVKSSTAVPLWFAQMLSEMEIYPLSFSKYGMEYRKYLMKNINIEGEILCLNQYSQQKHQFRQYQPAGRLSALQCP